MRGNSIYPSFLVGQEYPRDYIHLHLLAMPGLVLQGYPRWEKPGTESQDAWGALEASGSSLKVKVFMDLHTAARAGIEVRILAPEYVHVLIPRRHEHYGAVTGTSQM